MSTPVPLFDAIGLRMLVRRSRDPDQTRRLLALAEIYDGGSRPDAARIGGVGVQIVRDWVVRFNAKGPDGLLTGKAPGAPSILDEQPRLLFAGRQVVPCGGCESLCHRGAGSFGTEGRALVFILDHRAFPSC